MSCISHYSLRYGVLSPEQICRHAVRLGYDAVALTDRDNLYGLPEFLYQAKRHAIRAIIAAELSDRGGDKIALVYAHGDEGYANLCRIISERHCDESFSLSASIAADCNGLHVVTDALSLLGELRDTCRLYFRIRRLRRPPRWVADYGLPSVVIPDMAFIRQSDYAVHRLLRAIDGNTSLSRLSSSECLPSDALMRSWDEVRFSYAVFDKALETTATLCREIRSRDQFGAIIFPRVDSEKDAAALLRYKVCEGARQRYSTLTDAVLERMEHELGIIEQKGFSSYFLIVDDIVRQSPRTCGRGSAAASIVAYCLGITNVDPLRYNLLFERFLNPGRLDPPDIDVDFAWDERDSVLAYVFQKYGPNHAAMVATHGTFGMRHALRDVARVHGLTESEISVVAKRLPHFSHVTSESALATELDSGGIALDHPWPAIIADAQKLLGMPCGIGTHCGGVVITPGPIRDVAPVQYSAKGYPIVQWEKDGVEEMGLVKIDLLGNRSLAVIRDAVANLRREGHTLDERGWDPASDGSTNDLLGRGKTMGVFYVESPAMRLLQEKSQAGDFEHMVIHSSLIRPAANRHNKEYIRRLHGGDYMPVHPLLSETLAETYGIMVYQEDVTRVAMQLAGFSIVDGEGLRKIMSKKARRGKLKDYLTMFTDGARRNGVSDQAITQIWDMMMSFSGYSFCKPHSASYVQVSFQSAWLKVHYPAAFMAGVISNFGGFYSTQAYVSEAQRLGLRVVAPDCNVSAVACVSRGDELVIGLHLIKGLSKAAQKTIVSDRTQHGQYRSLNDLFERTCLDEADGERLILAGACDSLAPRANRSKLFWQLRRIFRGGSSLPRAPRLRQYSPMRLLACQYEMLGFLADIHPITLSRPRNRGNAVLIGHIRTIVGERVRFYGWCVTSRRLTTMKGEKMEFVTFEDETGIVETVLFPRVYAQFARNIIHREAFLVWGEVEEEFGAVYVRVEGVEAGQHKKKKGRRK